MDASTTLGFDVDLRAKLGGPAQAPEKGAAGRGLGAYVEESLEEYHHRVEWAVPALVLAVWATATVALERPAESVTEATELHHYAAGVLSKPAQEQPQVPKLADATVFSCTANAGEVLYVPAYWWHEVHSAAGAPGKPSIGVNWFYEAYYQRIFPNMSWDRSLHLSLIHI